MKKCTVGSFFADKEPVYEFYLKINLKIVGIHIGLKFFKVKMFDIRV